MNIKISPFSNITQSNKVTNGINNPRAADTKGALSSVSDFDKYSEAKAASGKLLVIDTSKSRVSFGSGEKEHTLNETLSIKNMTEAFGSIDLKPYMTGFPLQYPRKDFVRDFTNNLPVLSSENREKIMKKFDFKITETGDIIGYPQKDFDETDIPRHLKEPVKKAKELVNSFMYENRFKLLPGDEKAENVLNEIGKTFPEFFTVAGKKQHRLGSIDYHTVDDIKLCLNNPKIKEINAEDAKILMLGTLFHDFTKKEGIPDPMHPQTGAEASKKIMKKLPLTADEKERVYNFIRFSHWSSGCKSDDDLSVGFRHPGDFDISYIFADADSTSAGFFGISCTENRINNIRAKIDEINKNAIPLFPDNIPCETKNLETSKTGIKYMDFSNPDNDVSKYGFKKGTKAGDLRFMFLKGASLPGENNCINTEYKRICGGKNYGVIMSGYNSNIVLTSDKPYAAKSDKTEDFKALSGLTGETAPERKEIPELIRKKLNLTEEDYLKLYSAIGNLQDTDGVSDIELPGGRTLTKSEIKQTTEEIRALYENKNVLLYNSEAAALVVQKEDLLSETPGEEIKKFAELSEKHNLPLIAV